MRVVLLAALACALALPARAATIVFGRGADSQSMDAGEQQSIEDQKLYDLLYDGLTRFKGETDQVEPALATSWERSDDGLAWTFHLRTGVKFHDGSPFNAEAVQFTFDRQRDKSNPYYTPRFARWPTKFADMTAVEALDPNTIRLRFKGASPALLVNLAIFPGYIVSPTAVKADKEGFRTHPSGTGPFRFVRWEKDNLIELARFDEYWGGQPKPERVIVRTIPDNDVRLLALKKGEIQLTDDIPFNKWDEVEKDPALHLQTATSQGYAGLAMNALRKPYDDVRVRRAIAHAINRNRIYRTVFFGRGGLANQPMPPGTMGHADNVTTYDYDPEQAKKLLAEAGYPNGFKATLVAYTNPRPYFPSPRDGVALMKADLARVGIDAQIEMLSWPAYLARIDKDDFDLTLTGWTASTLDPDGTLYPLFDGMFVTVGSKSNTSRWKNAEADALLDKARSIYDPAERTKLYQQTSQIIADQAATVFFAHPVGVLASRANLKGVFRHPSNQILLQNATLE